MCIILVIQNVTLYGHIKAAEQQFTANTVIGTLAVDGWAVTFGTGQAGALPSPLLAVLDVTAHPSTASVLFEVAL